MEKWTPYILAGLGIVITILGWIFKHVVWEPLRQNGEDIGELQRDMVAVKAALKFYLETVSTGAAAVLNSPNPTPPRMRELLKKHVDRQITEAEQLELKNWLRELKDDVSAPKSERSAALQMLAALGAIRRLAA